MCVFGGSVLPEVKCVLPSLSGVCSETISLNRAWFRRSHRTVMEVTGVLKCTTRQTNTHTVYTYTVHPACTVDPHITLLFGKT